MCVCVCVCVYVCVCVSVCVCVCVVCVCGVCVCVCACVRAIEGLIEHFTKYGVVTDAVVMKDSVTKKPRSADELVFNFL